MRSPGPTRLLVYCGDYKCAHSIIISAERWPDDVRLSNLEPYSPVGLAASRGGASGHCSRITERRTLVVKASQTCGRLSEPAFKKPAGEIPTPPSEDIPLWPALCLERELTHSS